jgi:two-component system chemotaxis response regulator CheY
MQTNPQPPASPSTAKTVLVVDDFASVRFYHANLLRQAGYRSIDARDGFEAFEKLRQQRVDLILLDMIMPKMSGEEFIRRIRATSEFARIPLLVITSEAVKDSIRQFSGEGPLGFAMKPVLPATLLEAVHKLLA